MLLSAFFREFFNLGTGQRILLFWGVLCRGLLQLFIFTRVMALVSAFLFSVGLLDTLVSVSLAISGIVVVGTWLLGSLSGHSVSQFSRVMVLVSAFLCQLGFWIPWHLVVCLILASSLKEVFGGDAMLRPGFVCLCFASLDYDEAWIVFSFLNPPLLFWRFCSWSCWFLMVPSIPFGLWVLLRLFSRKSL